MLELFVNIRYQGTDTAIMTPCVLSSDAPVEQGQISAAVVLAPATLLSDAADIETSIRVAVASAPTRFVEAYRREYGFVLLGRAILCDDVRVRGTALGGAATSPATALAPAATPPTPSTHASVYFDGGRVSTPIFQLASMCFGQVVCGPALLVDSNSTIVVEPGFEAAVTAGGDIEITAVDAPVAAAGSLVEAGTVLSADSGAVDLYTDVPAVPVQLSIFGHRFMGIAEQMGRVLQRTSISVNIRERLVRQSVFGRG